MTEAVDLKGQCMCGAVKINATGVSPEVAVCHCSMCRRWSAGPFMEVTCQDVTFVGHEHVGKIRSSEWAERSFCKECGSVLFYQLIDSSDYQVSAGLFDDQSKFRMSLQVFIDDKPDFYEYTNKTQTTTSAEVYAAYAPLPK